MADRDDPVYLAAVAVREVADHDDLAVAVIVITGHAVVMIRSETIAVRCCVGVVVMFMCDRQLDEITLDEGKHQFQEIWVLMHHLVDDGGRLPLPLVDRLGKRCEPVGCMPTECFHGWKFEVLDGVGHCWKKMKRQGGGLRENLTKMGKGADATKVEKIWAWPPAGGGN